MRTFEVLEALKGYASNYKKAGIIKSVKGNKHMNDLLEDSKITEDEALAVVVDFINYIGMQNCVDYGLYTRDI